MDTNLKSTQFKDTWREYIQNSSKILPGQAVSNLNKTDSKEYLLKNNDSLYSNTQPIGDNENVNKFQSIIKMTKNWNSSNKINDIESQIPLKHPSSSKPATSWWNIENPFSSSSQIESTSYFDLNLTRWQRFTCFIFLIALGLFCLFFSFINLPIAILRPQKFILPFTFGCLLFSISFGFLIGWSTYMQQLGTKERLPIALFNFFMICFTIVASLKIKSYPLIVVCSILQFCGLVTLIFSLIPGGVSALFTSTRFLGGFMYKSVLS